jgi:hypothetical protein
MPTVTLAAAKSSSSQSVLALLITLAIAFSCSLLAGRKGRNRVLWSVAGFFFSVFALVIIAVLPRRRSAGTATGTDLRA